MAEDSDRPESPETPADEAAEPPAPPTFPPEAKTEGLAWLREVTTTIIALVVVAVTSALLCLAFAAAGKPGFEDKKDVMLYGMTILGTVVGYYFGRVPAERRAEASEETAKKAQTTATGATAAAAEAKQEKNEATKKLADVKVGVERVKSALAPAAGAQRQTPGGLELAGAAPPADPSREAYLELEVLSRLL